MPAATRRMLLAALLTAGAAAADMAADMAATDRFSRTSARARQTPDELGFSDTGEEADGMNTYGKQEFGPQYCLDIGAKGFPLPTFTLLKEAKWDPVRYFERLQTDGYGEDALQMTGPEDAMLKSDCMTANFRGRTKHIFVGDSQMMALRNAFHRLNRCPEIWYENVSADQFQMLDQSLRAGRSKARGRHHSHTDQAPGGALPEKCREEGIASYIFWDSWVDEPIPVKDIQKEMELVGVDPKEGDTVVVWVGSNFLPARRRMSALLNTINALHEMGVKMIWDSPTFQDEAIMAAVSSVNLGHDSHTDIPIVYGNILRRKTLGELGSNEYKTEKNLFEGGIEVPMTRRWQLTNRYRGLQCDGMHTDMRARDPLFYDLPCPAGRQSYGASTHCHWVEPVVQDAVVSCPRASGIDDLVLQSGLYSACAAHERPFCYSYTEDIR